MRGAWGVGRGAWGVMRGAWGVMRGAWGVSTNPRRTDCSFFQNHISCFTHYASRTPHHAPRTTHHASIPQFRADIRTVHRRVTAGAVTGAELQVSGMIFLADDNLAGSGLNFGMALQAQVDVAFEEHLRVERTVGCMADRAAFAERLVLEDERARLLPVALGARFVEP